MISGINLKFFNKLQNYYIYCWFISFSTKSFYKYSCFIKNESKTSKSIKIIVCKKVYSVDTEYFQYKLYIFINMKANTLNPSSIPLTK